MKKQKTIKGLIKELDSLSKFIKDNDTTENFGWRVGKLYGIGLAKRLVEGELLDKMLSLKETNKSVLF